MGIAGIGIGQLLVIFLVVVLLFGTKRLRALGSDLGGALKGFRRAVHDGEEAAKDVSATGEDAAGKPLALTHAPEPKGPEASGEGKAS